MTKRSFLAAALSAAPLDNMVEMFVYFVFVDGAGLGRDLFEDEPNQHTAHFTLRADRLRPVFT